MTKKLECEIVQDLLPMYVDDLTSDYTSECVKAHLEECPPCQSIYEMMKDEPVEQVQQNVEEAKKLRWYMKKFKVINWLIGAVVALLIYFFGWYLYNLLFVMPTDPVSSDLIEVTELYELENGWIYLTLSSKETYPITSYGVEWSEFAPNEMKLLFKKSIFSRKEEEQQQIRTYIINPESGEMAYYSDGERESESYGHNYSFTIEEYVQREFYYPYEDKTPIDIIYYEGKNKDDRIIIWERGMELPRLEK